MRFLQGLGAYPFSYVQFNCYELAGQDPKIEGLGGLVEGLFCTIWQGQPVGGYAMRTLLALLAVTLMAQASDAGASNPFENERCEIVIVTLPDNSKLQCEVCDGVTRRCAPI